MNPLNTLEKAKEWATKSTSFYSKDIEKRHHVVCRWNDGYIVHNVRHIEEHYKEYSSDEIVYCTDKNEMKRLFVMLRFKK
jgi:hypothetical protein